MRVSLFFQNIEVFSRWGGIFCRPCMYAQQSIKITTPGRNANNKVIFIGQMH